MARDLGARREQLTDAELKELRSRLRRGRRADRATIQPAPEGAEPVLSFAQQRLWFLDRFEPGGSEYNVPVGLRLRGELDEAALRRALEGVVARHQVLRTSFGAQRGQPLLKVHEAVEVPFEVVDVASEEEVQRRAAELARRPFELDRAPLLRGLLMRLGERERVLVLSFHHIVTDGWSEAVFTRELSELYAGAELEPLEVQYGDYARWQREWLSGEELERQLGYWRERLGGLEALELATDRPRPAVRSARGGSVEVRLDAELTGRLRELAKEIGATLHQVLMA